MKRQRYALILICTMFISTMTVQQAFSQSNSPIDSLKNELRLFDAKKKALGANAPKMIDTLKIEILRKLCAQYFAINPNEVFPYAKEELLLSQKIHFKKGIGNAHNVLGTYYDFKSNYPKAMEHYEIALQAKTETKDVIGQMDLYNNIGVLYSNLANFPKAMQYLLKGLEISRKANDIIGIFSSYNNIGIIYQTQNL